jgi:hypothetical protein
MIKQVLLALALLGVSSAAQAQVREGAFKLSIDTDVMSYTAITEKADDFDASYTESYFTFGPGGTALGAGLPGYVGLALGYVAHRHVIPQLHASFALASSSVEFQEAGSSTSEDGPFETALMLRPELEIPFNPDSGVVGFGLVGLDYRRLSASEDDLEASVHAIGPVVGVGLHSFYGEHVSLDLAAQLSYQFVSQSVVVDGVDESPGDNSDITSVGFAVSLGLSLWP